MLHVLAIRSIPFLVFTAAFFIHEGKEGDFAQVSHREPERTDHGSVRDVYQTPTERWPIFIDTMQTFANNVVAVTSERHPAEREWRHLGTR